MESGLCDPFLPGCVFGDMAVEGVEAHGGFPVPFGPDNAGAVVCNVAGALVVTDEDAVAGASAF